jgi:hypothetical protein
MGLDAFINLVTKVGIPAGFAVGALWIMHGLVGAVRELIKRIPPRDGDDK